MSKNKQGKKVLQTVMGIFPDNRPITALQVIEHCEKCPATYTPIQRTYDQDNDADLGKDSNIIFGVRKSRYLCISKTEGPKNCVLESIKVISEKEKPPTGFTAMSITMDTHQRAWKKRQIIYKLSKLEMVTNAVTDIILCSKLRNAPEGFEMAGEVNGILVCYKLHNCKEVPNINVDGSPKTHINHIGKELADLRLTQNINVYPSINDPGAHDYENLKPISPSRPAPRPPPKPPQPTPIAPVSNGQTGTLSGVHLDIEGVPFLLNPNLSKDSFNILALCSMTPKTTATTQDYDFHLERQILCTTKSTASSKNPFFN